MRASIALLLALVVASDASARAIPVPPGSAGIQQALSGAGAGDVIQLAAGQYQERIVIDGRDVILQGDAAGGTLLLPPASLEAWAEPLENPAGAGAVIIIRNGSRVTLRDLSIDGSGLTGPGIYVEGGAVAARTGGGGVAAETDYQIVLENGCLIGSGQVGSVGFKLVSTGGAVQALLRNMIIRNWGTAIKTVGAGALVTARDNALTPNLVAAFDNTAGGGPQDARFNWWGSADGPGGVGPGTGDAVLGPNVTFLPWRLNGIDVDPECGFNPAPDNVVTPGPADTCLSTAHPCATIPVTIARTDNASIRGFSVTLQLSAELALCTGPGSITEGSYLSDVNPVTDFHVIDNGGGSWTVDDAILGLPCGAVAVTGTLFNVSVRATVPLGTGTITVTAVLLRDCDNLALAGSPGPPLSVPMDAVAPGAPTDLAAAQIKSGNDADGTTEIRLTFALPPEAVAVEVYRAPFGNYPEYDDPPGAGSPPAAPGWPPGAPWALTSVTASGQADEVAVRDFWYYVAFAFDACGNASAASSRTTGTLNYHLGDFHDGSTDCAGENRVSTPDLSFLGANYGIALGPSDPLGCLDVGPTVDYSVNARPLTDNVVDFEDLIILALNYGLVSKPRLEALEAPTGPDRVWLEVPGQAPAGGLLDVSIRLDGAGDLRGMSLDLDYDHGVVEPVAVSAGELLARQGTPAVVLSSRPGNVDVALLGACRGLSGAGEAARVTFRSLAAGDPRIAIIRARGRDAGNRDVPLTPGPGAAAAGPGPAPSTWLGMGYPNPFRGTAVIPFSLARAGRARVDVFDVRGRRVRTLLNGELPAGPGSISWDGRDAAGVPVPSGWYTVCLDTGRRALSRALRLVR